MARDWEEDFRQLRLWLVTGDEEGECPPWYLALTKARELCCPPWEFCEMLRHVEEWPTEWSDVQFWRQAVVVAVRAEQWAERELENRCSCPAPIAPVRPEKLAESDRGSRHSDAKADILAIVRHISSPGAPGNPPLPDWYAVDAVARRYGISPVEVEQMDAAWFYRALMAMEGEARGEEEHAKRWAKLNNPSRH